MDRIDREGTGSSSRADSRPSASVATIVPAFRKRRDIVVISVALAGVGSLYTLLDLLPGDFPGALLVVLQAESCSTTLLLPALRLHCKRPVAYAREGEAVSASQLVLSTPDHHLIVRENGLLGLDKGPKVLGSRPAADCLFESAAKVFGTRVIGIVLTGGEQDGIAGLRAIKAAGGLSIVQHPVEPQTTVMPLNTQDRENPDFCVKLNVLGALLSELVLSTPTPPQEPA